MGSGTGIFIGSNHACEGNDFSIKQFRCGGYFKCRNERCLLHNSCESSDAEKHDWSIFGLANTLKF